MVHSRKATYFASYLVRPRFLDLAIPVTPAAVHRLAPFWARPGRSHRTGDEEQADEGRVRSRREAKTRFFPGA